MNVLHIMEVGMGMYSKEARINEKVKINRYNQIDLIGSYGVKDNYLNGSAVKKRSKDDEVSWLMWFVIIIITIIPGVNILSLLIMARTNININIKNYAKAALLFIIMVVVLFLLYL